MHLKKKIFPENICNLWYYVNATVLFNTALKLAFNICEFKRYIHVLPISTSKMFVNTIIQKILFEFDNVSLDFRKYSSYLYVYVSQGLPTKPLCFMWSYVVFSYPTLILHETRLHLGIRLWDTIWPFISVHLHYLCFIFM